MRRFEYLVPATLKEAVRFGARPAAGLKAGGVDLLDRMKEGIERPALVVGLHGVLDGEVRFDEREGVRIGAGIRLADLARHPDIGKALPSLARAAGETATPQVREMATLGGNLLQRPRCWYFRSRHYETLKNGGPVCYAHEGRNEYHALFDNRGCAAVHPSNVLPALVSLRARAGVEGRGGRSEIPIDRLFTRASDNPKVEHVLKPGDVLTEILVPAESLGPRAAHYDIRQKQSFDWPLALAAVNLNGPRPLLVLGAVASVPLKVRGVKEILALPEGGAASAANLEMLAAAAVQGATPLSKNAWRLPLVKTAVRRAVLTALNVPEEQW
ncbi:MAG: FAD binding domain-containing protein [Planctomycetota bacterium]